MYCARPEPVVPHSTGGSDSTDKHCVFRSGTTWFSVPATSVREISIAPELVRIPDFHPSLVGLCHLRSEFIPVVLLNSLLNIDVSDNDHPHDKLLVLGGQHLWALLIAEATALETLETLVTPDSRSDDPAQTAVRGTAMHGDRIVRVLDPVQAFQLAQQTLGDLWRHDDSTTLSRPFANRSSN